MQSASSASTTQPLEPREPKAKQQPRPQELSSKALKNSTNDFGHFASSTLHLTLWQLYQKGKYTNFTVTCGGRSFQVHKVVESIENRIVLPDEEPDMVERLIQFLYTGNYVDGEYFDELPSTPALMEPDDIKEELWERFDGFLNILFDDSTHNSDYDPDEDSSTEEHPTEPLEYDSECSDHSSEFRPSENPYQEDCSVQLFTSLRMYVIGDKYDIPALQLLAKKRFTQTTACHWTTYNDFPAVLDELFTTTRTTDPLRRLVCTLMERDYATNPAMRIKIRPIVEKHGDLALNMLDLFSTHEQTA
ncbi:hypothetical protein N8T08_003933 [Aspergillus melleus]|uniref:Uncharacterized protein n=1 Tax=Aspergillus melleus TaxID=138277 RepID=A0ACC3B5F1_9EURO|nr:hypothetical protein N8T08_003933 [Aspergillus melleus]